MSVLTPWTPARRPTVYLDYATGAGVDDAGRMVRPRIGGRRTRPSVVDLLDTARAAGAERVYLTGARPPADWLLTRTEGWTAGAHYLDSDLPIGRYNHGVDGAAVMLRRAAEWLGDGTYTPVGARDALEALTAVYGRHVPGGRLFDSPAATGLDAWIRSLPYDADAGGHVAPEPVSPETAKIIRATSAQHRVELVHHGSNYAGGKLPGFHYLDGRMMYAALTRELGTGPSEWFTGRDCEAFLAADPAASYRRARYHVTATVPAGWDHVGLLMCQEPDTGRWHCPRWPGQTLETWCDSAELALARSHGWPVTIREGFLFTRGRPLDTLTGRLLRAREYVARDYPGELGTRIRGAIRAILLHTIGAFHSTGRDVTRVVDSPMAYRGAGALEQHGPVWIARERHELAGRYTAGMRPELSAQVWGRAHARVLESPTPTRGIFAGALYTRPADLIGIRGDALYMAAQPRWGDDGRVGRLRVKGHLHGPVSPPATYTDLNVLREAAEAGGAHCERCPA